MISLPTAPTARLDGRRALVIGASSGIGLGAATILASHGAAVTIAARRHTLLREIAEAFASRGWKAETARLDISNTEETAAYIERHGPFDIFVNCAGISRNSPALETLGDDFDAVMDTNFKGAYFATQSAARALVRSGRPGSLINISSQLAYVGGENRAVYSASKYALEGMTKSMAIEWGSRGIRVNTICPTFIETARTEETLADPEKLREICGKIKLGRTGTVEDVMGAVLYLASDLSLLVTGTAVMVDGGWTAD